MIHVITGHICAGKTTYVQQHRKPVDVVIDMDLIAQAMRDQRLTGHHFEDAHREIARTIRWHAIQKAVEVHNRERDFDVWIVHAYPTGVDENRYRMIGATMKEITADAATLRERAKARPKRMRDELEKRLTGAM